MKASELILLALGAIIVFAASFGVCIFVYGFVTAGGVLDFDFTKWPSGVKKAIVFIAGIYTMFFLFSHESE